MRSGAQGGLGLASDVTDDLEHRHALPRVAPRAPRDRTRRPAGLPRHAQLFVAGVIATSVLVNIGMVWNEPAPTFTDIVVWTLVALVSQIMIFPTSTGRGDVSLGTCVHLSMALVLGPAVALPSLWLSRAIAALTVQRKPWVRAAFNAAQVTASVAAAIAVMRLAGVPTRLEPTLGLIVSLPGFIAAAAAYYAVNMGLVSTVIGLSAGRSPLAVWREDFADAPVFLGTIALTLLAPVTALTYESFGTMGLVFFLLPMAFLWDSSRRYVTLRRTQEALVAAECLAARAGLAAEVGHAINNKLAAVQGQLQLLERSADTPTSSDLRQRVQRVIEPLSRIDRLSKRLMDLSRRETAVEPTAVAELVTQTISMLRFQRRFATIRFETDVERSIGEAWIDPAQVQQALISLIVNAAEAMETAGTHRPIVTIRARLTGNRGTLEIGVEDNGPGIPASQRNRVFEPGFTTRPDNRGFGLTTVREIVRGHQGSAEMQEAPAGGCRVALSFPVRGPAVLVNVIQRAEDTPRGPALLGSLRSVSGTAGPRMHPVG